MRCIKVPPRILLTRSRAWWSAYRTPTVVANSQAKSIMRRLRCSAVNPGRTGLPSDGTARSTRVWKRGWCNNCKADDILGGSLMSTCSSKSRTINSVPHRWRQDEEMSFLPGAQEARRTFNAAREVDNTLKWAWRIPKLERVARFADYENEVIKTPRRKRGAAALIYDININIINNININLHVCMYVCMY